MMMPSITWRGGGGGGRWEGRSHVMRQSTDNQPTTDNRAKSDTQRMMVRRDNQPTTAQQHHGLKTRRRLRVRAMRGGEGNQPTMAWHNNQPTMATQQSTDDGTIRSRREEAEGVEGDERGEAAWHDNQPDDAQGKEDGSSYLRRQQHSRIMRRDWWRLTRLPPQLVATRTITTMGDRPTLPFLPSLMQQSVNWLQFGNKERREGGDFGFFIKSTLPRQDCCSIHCFVVMNFVLPLNGQLFYDIRIRPLSG